ncbi:10898_t:CDS:2 [Funneliformis geosporum]|uniref:470_t:CDS:1 n=1 Tax=Funneliformis geosporum TaxID=1117311 RepID=A0A9W4SCP0_9GLOM|nr:10898_t:CDS:2 [Funneliformis geosporum]CAI2164453.1 470_t:CDS:2 [Funneliformis geosporum]
MAQPNYTNVSQALSTLSHEVTLASNIPNLVIANQLTTIQNSLANLSNTVANLSNTVTNLSSTVTNLSSTVTNLTNNVNDLTITIQTTAQNSDRRNLARIFNSRLSDPDLQLEIVPDMSGNDPPNYPQSITRLREMSARRKRFAKYLGIQLL